MKPLIYLSILLLGAVSVVGAAPTTPLFQMEDTAQILVNNRILATVNGNAISVIDVMKKMDMMFYKQYPQYTSSIPARFQFYKLSWKHILQDFIDKELIIADSQESKLPISNGDVRQEMEKIFGPNIILNLDKAGLTFDEAWKMTKEELILRRMLHYRVNAKAIRKVTPLKVRTSYEEYAKKNILPEQWHYQVITIRDPDAQNGAGAANLAFQLLSEQHSKIDEVIEKVKNTAPFNDTVKITVSELFQHQEKDMSPAYKTALTLLSEKSYSQPMTQKSRADNSTVFRIFYLQAHVLAGAVPFSEVEDKLKEELIETAMDDETTAYLKKLRDHYHVNQDDVQGLIGNGFDPFELK